jgi:hypothetical protein
MYSFGQNSLSLAHDLSACFQASAPSASAGTLEAFIAIPSKNITWVSSF